LVDTAVHVSATSLRPLSRIIVTIFVDIVLFTNKNLPAYSMEQITYRKASRFAASQKIPRILWNPEVRYSIHKNPPSVPILNHVNQFRALHPIS
jgi:hypothetical protein